LKHAETVVGRLLSIVETTDLRAQAEQINALERDIIATSHAISCLDDEFADIASRGMPHASGASDLPLDTLTTLIANREAYAWFTDRPARFLSETDPLIVAVDEVREARLRLADELRYVDEEPPELASLPDVATIARLHKDLQRTAERTDGESHDNRLARRIVATLGADGADKFALDLDALAAAHRVIAEEPWLAALSPVGPQPGGASVDGAMLVDFARDASSLLSQRAGFLTRPVETPADAFADQELITVVERLAGGERAFTKFSLSGRALKQTVDAIRVAGFAPKTAADWEHVRDYLTWRRHLHSLDARWRLLAAELGAPAPDRESCHTLHDHERIAKSVEVAIVMAALAKRNVLAVVPRLSMPIGAAELLGNRRRLTTLAAAVRDAAKRVADQRMELTRLHKLFCGCGAMATQVRADVLSQIGRDDVDTREIEKRWTAVRARLQALHDRREDVELLDAVCQAMAQAGAGAFARRIRTEPADRDGGDPVLVADWRMAWNWAALMRQTEGVGQHRRLRDLSDQRMALETRLRELFEQVVVARVHLGFAQNMSSDVRQALGLFMITLRKMAATCSGPTAWRLREVAREALESCYEGIPCQLVPAWRAVEQLPARLGAFDLVVIDNASQSDLRELTAVLRGRKVVVVEEDRQTAEVTEQADRNIESIEYAVLRSAPATMRQLLLPGSGLCDLVKLLFPDRTIRLREHAYRVNTVALPTSTSSPYAEAEAAAIDVVPAVSPLAGAAEGSLPSASPLMHPAYSLEDEIATVAEGLSVARLSRGQRAEPAVLMQGPLPEWLSNRTGGSMPGDEPRAPRWPERDIAADEKRNAVSADVPVPASPAWSEPVVSLASVTNEPRHRADRFVDAVSSPLDDAVTTATVLANAAETFETTRPRVEVEALHAPGGIDPARLPARRLPLTNGMPKRPLRRRMMAAAAVVAVMMVGAAAYWQPTTNRLATSWRTALDQLAASWNAASPAVAQPAGTEPRKVTASRIAPDAKNAAGGDGAGGSATEPVVSHAVLYQEDPQDPHGKRYLGTVTWHVEPATGSVPASIKGDVEIDKRMKATLSLRPNVESEMPASHIMEVKFNWPDDPSHVGVDALKGVSMKTRESGRGAPLSALAAKVTPEFFMIALSAGDVDAKRNVLLLKGKEWIDIPIVYSGGSRAVLAIEKGADGERAFKDAFAAWGQ
jgi:hypothetical protein